MSRMAASVVLGRVAYGLLFVIVLPLVLAFWASWLDRFIAWPVPHVPAVALATVLFGGLLMFRMSLSLLLGHDLPAMAARFADALHGHQPLFSLPAPDDPDAGGLKRLAMLGRIFLPWLVALYFLDHARGGHGPGGSFASPSQSGTSGPAMAPYLFVIAMLLAARTNKTLRQAVLAGTVATILGLYLDVILSALVPKLTGAPGSATATHLLAVIAGANARGIWGWLQRITEQVANSRQDRLCAGGHFRVINHSLYSGLAGALGVGIVGSVTARSAAAVIILACVLVGSVTFTQASWGSRSLLRPFGYWGGVLGGAIGIAIIHLAFDVALARIALAVVLAATFVWAVGRLRCLAQGCCHGVPAKDGDAGIRVWQPQSRVVVLSHLEGVRILNTQLYSILFNLALGPLLWSMWLGGTMSGWMIVGMYLLLTGIERFAEDAYRGETQTKTLRGLRENQWVAIGALCAGLIVAALPATEISRGGGTMDTTWLATVLVGGALSAFAMSMDFPGSSRRFSRLTG